jgi:hypothetical protein
MEYVNTLKSHGIKVDDASASFKAELDRHRHNDEDATHATVTWGDDCKELVRQALLTASRAGRSDVGRGKRSRVCCCT